MGFFLIRGQHYVIMYHKMCIYIYIYIHRCTSICRVLQIDVCKEAERLDLRKRCDKPKYIKYVYVFYNTYLDMQRSISNKQIEINA